MAGQRLMDLEVDALCGAGYGERSAARDQWRKVVELMDSAEEDVPAHMAWSKDLRTEFHSTNPLEQNDEWATTGRYMNLEAVRELCQPEDIDPLSLAAE